MDPLYKSRFNHAILAEAAHRFGVEPDELIELDGFESFVYEIPRASGDCILRIGHASRRSENLIHGEVDWINYLADGMGPATGLNAGVASAVLSARGCLVEVLDDGFGEHFLAVAFRKASGHAPRSAELTPAVIETYGQMIGRMHTLTAPYHPTMPAWRRPHFDDPLISDVDALLPANETAAREQYQRVMTHLRSLPRNDPAAYGLIHQDAHSGNFFLNERGMITLFDFDDCCYSWFANDIAIILFYAAPWQPDLTAFTRDFLTHFFTGYRREHRLNPVWLAEIPHFLKLREIELYAVIHRSFDVTNLTDPWVSGYMQGRKERIAANTPLINFDFTSLASEL